MGKRRTTVNLKTIEVGKTGIELTIEVSKESGHYQATYSRQTVFSNEDEKLEDFERRLREWVLSLNTLEWRDMIEIEPATGGYGFVRENVVGMKLERYQVAWSGKKWLTRRWDVGYPETDAMPFHGVETAERVEKDPLYGVSDYGHFKTGGQGIYKTIRPEDLTFPYREGEYHNARQIKLYVVEYTEELWTGLRMLQTRIRELREQLMAILDNPAAHEQIAVIGAQQLRLLPAPQEEVEA